MFPCLYTYYLTPQSAHLSHLREKSMPCICSVPFSSILQASKSLQRCPETLPCFSRNFCLSLKWPQNASSSLVLLHALSSSSPNPTHLALSLWSPFYSSERRECLTSLLLLFHKAPQDQAQTPLNPFLLPTLSHSQHAIPVSPSLKLFLEQAKRIPNLGLHPFLLSLTQLFTSFLPLCSFQDKFPSYKVSLGYPDHHRPWFSISTLHYSFFQCLTFWHTPYIHLSVCFICITIWLRDVTLSPWTRTIQQTHRKQFWLG